MPRLYANNAATVTAADVASGDTSIPVNDASSFPTLGAGDSYLATLVQVDGNGNETAWEIVNVTGRERQHPDGHPRAGGHQRPELGGGDGDRAAQYGGDHGRHASDSGWIAHQNGGRRPL